MNYTLRISPTARQALSEVLEQYPYPDIIETFWSAAVRLARNPEVNQRSTVYGRQWFSVEYRTPSITLHLQVTYRINEDEAAIEITDVGPFRF